MIALNTLKLEPATGGWFTVSAPYIVIDYKRHEPLVVPAGFMTDLASVPWFLRWLIRHDHPYLLEASVVHDYLYTRRVGARFYHYSRRQADRLLYGGMRSAGAPFAFAAAVYVSVRAFGWLRWRVR